MKKTIYFVCLLLSVLLFAGCSRIINMIEVDKEKIGAEYTGVNITKKSRRKPPVNSQIKAPFREA